MVTLSAGSRCCAVSNKKHKNQTHMQTSDRTYKTHQMKLCRTKTRYSLRLMTALIEDSGPWLEKREKQKGSMSGRNQGQFSSYRTGNTFHSYTTQTTPHPNPFQTLTLIKNTHGKSTHAKMCQNLLQNKAKNVACYSCKHVNDSVWRDNHIKLWRSQRKRVNHFSLLWHNRYFQYWAGGTSAEFSVPIACYDGRCLDMNRKLHCHQMKLWSKINKFLTCSYIPENLINTGSDHISPKIKRKKNISVLRKQRKSRSLCMEAFFLPRNKK